MPDTTLKPRSPQTTHRLLGPDEPPIERVNPQGHAPVLLLCDHASRRVPRALNALGLDEAALRRHIAWDIGAAEVTRCLAVHLDAPALLGGCSRLVIDLNRAPDEPTSIVAASDGTEVPGNQGLSAAEVEQRRSEIFHPYHDTVAAEIDAFLARDRVPVIVSVHSFTPVMDGFERPWHVGVLWTRDDRMAGPLMDVLGADPALRVGDNEPYSAHDAQGHTMRVHGNRRGLAHALIEVRQDLIDTRQGAAAWADRLAGALRRVLDDPGLYEVRPVTAREEERA